MASEDTGTKHERSFVRTEDHIPIYYERWQEGDIQTDTTDWESLLDGVDISSPADAKILNLLLEVNNKLDLLVKHFSIDTGRDLPEAKDVVLSASGLKFISTDDFQTGDIITLKLYLSSFSQFLCVRAEVVRNMGPKDGGHEIAAKFMDIDENKRERLIKYIFNRQRELLRSDEG